MCFHTLFRFALNSFRCICRVADESRFRYTYRYRYAVGVSIILLRTPLRFRLSEIETINRIAVASQRLSMIENALLPLAALRKWPSPSKRRIWRDWETKNGTFKILKTKNTVCIRIFSFWLAIEMKTINIKLGNLIDRSQNENPFAITIDARPLIWISGSILMVNHNFYSPPDTHIGDSQFLFTFVAHISTVTFRS